ncbi:MAG: ABC transporter substrate-binding protein [Opitutaceae bacterium]|nr:ABC transporter substrate-binding protein [Opitutaceae bacterium]
MNLLRLMFPRTAVLLVGCLMLSASVSHAAPAAPAADPAPALVAVINSVIDIVLGKSPDAISSLLPQIRTKMSESFAVDAIVQRAFGRNWTKLTPAQQTEAVDLLGKLIIRTYATQLASGSRPTLAVTASREIGPDRREIVSTATQDGKVVNVIYRLAPVDGQWKVYDVLAENVSVVGNYRQQFDAHFTKKSADELLTLLRSKLEAPVVVEKGKS